MSKAEREIARAKGFDVMVEDHGWLVMSGAFEYGESGGSGQGLGYSIDADFIKGFLEAFGVDRLQAVNGRPCWVTHTHDKIMKIEPLFAKDGTPFDIEAWAANLRAKRDP